MEEWLAWLVSAAGGVALGAFYYAGLWWTVSRLPRSRAPALLNFGSFFLRTTVVLVGFFALMAGRWERLALALAGLILSRQVILAVVRRGVSAPGGAAGKKGTGKKAAGKTGRNAKKR